MYKTINMDKSSEIKLIIFDLDGVLAESCTAHYYSFKKPEY